MFRQLEQFIEELELKRIPSVDLTDLKNNYHLDIFKYRNIICRKYGMYALVDSIWTKKLAEWIGNRRVLEIQSGRGWLAKALHEHGVSIIATDQKKSSDIFHVEELERLEAIKKYGSSSDILLLSWPYYKDEKIVDIVEEWGYDKLVVYIGELANGCCAHVDFFKYFKYDKNITFPMPRWSIVYDYVFVGKFYPLLNEENDNVFE